MITSTAHHKSALSSPSSFTSLPPSERMNFSMNTVQPPIFSNNLSDVETVASRNTQKDISHYRIWFNNIPVEMITDIQVHQLQGGGDVRFKIEEGSESQLWNMLKGVQSIVIQEKQSRRAVVCVEQGHLVEHPCEMEDFSKQTVQAVKKQTGLSWMFAAAKTWVVESTNIQSAYELFYAKQNSNNPHHPFLEKWNVNQL